MGFSILMFGMSTMSAAVEPLRYSETFLTLMISLSHPLLGFVVGAVFTAVIQSSAAAVGILQALSLTGALSFAEAFPLLLGIAVAMIELQHDQFDTHEYIDSLKQIKSEAFEENYETFRKQYSIE